MEDTFKFPDEIEEKGVEKDGSADEFEIEVVDDTPPADRGRKPLDKTVDDPTDDELSAYSDKVQSRIKELTHARHDERRAKEALLREKQELETLAQRLVEDNKRLKQYADNGNQAFAQQAKSAAETELEVARKKFREAQEAFDTDAILAAQEELMMARLRVEQAKNFKPTPLQTDTDVVQTQLTPKQAPQLDERTLRWQAKNQWFLSEGFEEVTSYALGLHQKLVNSGVDPQSAKYFETIDANIRTKFPEVFSEEKPATSKKPASVVAPAGRASGAKRVQLTPTALALAKKLGLTPQQYAAHVAKLES